MGCFRVFQVSVKKGGYFRGGDQFRGAINFEGVINFGGGLFRDSTVFHHIQIIEMVRN